MATTSIPAFGTKVSTYNFKYYVQRHYKYFKWNKNFNCSPTSIFKI